MAGRIANVLTRAWKVSERSSFIFSRFFSLFIQAHFGEKLCVVQKD